MIHLTIQCYGATDNLGTRFVIRSQFGKKTVPREYSMKAADQEFHTVVEYARSHGARVVSHAPDHSNPDRTHYILAPITKKTPE